LGNALWSPRCLIAPIVFDHRIWLYGGAEEPSSAELFHDLYTCSYAPAQGAKWEKQELTGVIEGSESRKPIASCLQVFKGKLYVFGKFRTVHHRDNSRLDEPLGFCLSDPSTRTWERFPTDGLKTWGAHTTFSYQAVNFKDKMLIAKALGYQTGESPVLKIYVPG